MLRQEKEKKALPCYNALIQMSFVIGIDEVGRGALAGPVVVACVLANRKGQIANRKLGKLRDSKKLTPKQREAWFEYFKGHPKIEYALARVYPRQIEKRNISRAANLAAKRAYKRLLAWGHGSRVMGQVYLDGGLFLGNGKQPKNARTIVRGDEKIKAIAAASIVAKVTRDRAMVRLAKQYPRYGFEVHKGYGTRAHMRAIKRYGPAKAHRLTFLG